jgi:hypothetical protein
MSLLSSVLDSARPDADLAFLAAPNTRSHPERLPAVLHLLAGRLRQRRQPAMRSGGDQPPAERGGKSQLGPGLDFARPD